MRKQNGRQPGIRGLIGLAQPDDEAIAILRAGVLEQRLHEFIMWHATIERLLSMDDSSQSEPRAARLIARRVAIAANDAALAFAVENGRHATSAERHDDAMHSAVRAEQSGVGVALHGKSGERRCLRAKRSQPVAIVDACQAASEHTMLPVQRDARAGKRFLACSLDGLPRALDAEPES